jgi:hypothetical protein
MKLMRPSRAFVSATIILCAIVASCLIMFRGRAISRPTNNRSIIACSELMGLHSSVATSSLKHASLASSSSEMAKIWEQLGCTTKIHRNAIDANTLKLPALALLDRKWCLLASRSDNGDEICRIQNSVDWVSTRTVMSQIEGQEVLELTRPANRDGDPKLSIFQEKVDLGVGDQSKAIERDVTIFNISNSPVSIEKQAFSCGCTSAELDRTQIEPWSYCRARIRLDTKAVPIGTPKVKWLITTSVPKMNRAFEVSASVEQTVALEPGYFNLGKVATLQPIKEITTKLTVPYVDVRKVAVTPVHLDHGVRINEIKATSEGKELTLSINALEAYRDLKDHFRVEAIFAIENLREGRKLFSIVIDGRLTRAIEVTPTEVSLGRILPGEKVTRTIFFSSQVEGNPIVSAVHSEYVTANVTGESIDLEITGPPSPGIFRTAVLLRIGNESINVPLTGLITDQIASSTISHLDN